MCHFLISIDWLFDWLIARWRYIVLFHSPLYNPAATEPRSNEHSSLGVWMNHCAENRGRLIVKATNRTRACARDIRVGSWIQRIPRGGFSSHSHGNPIARLYASLAPGNGVNAVKSGFGPVAALFALAPTVRSYVRTYVRTFSRMYSANRAAAARNDDLSRAKCE